MQENGIIGILNQAFQDLNSKDNKSHYFDLHDESLVTHGIPGNFPSNKEGMKMYYSEVWRAFPDANYEFDHAVIQGNEAAFMFSLTGTHKGEFMGIPASNKQIKIDGMIFFRFNASKIVERWEIIDILAAAKQLGVRQQFSAIRNAILEYAEVQTNVHLREKIDGLFKKHLSTE